MMMEKMERSCVNIKTEACKASTIVKVKASNMEDKTDGRREGKAIFLTTFS